MAKTLFILSLVMTLALQSVEFVLFTQPKTGTHLLIPILTELTGKDVYWAKEYRDKGVEIDIDQDEAYKNPQYFFFSIQAMPWKRGVMENVWKTNQRKGTFLHLHAPYSATMESYLAEKNCINFFIKRDPRDQILSLLNHYKYIQYNEKEVEELATDEERLLYLIQHSSKKQTAQYMGWLNSPQCCALNFEKLMGGHGGAATDREALIEMRKIAAALKMRLPDKTLLNIYRKHFGKGWNFFRGKVGSWKESFTEEHKAAIKSEIGDLLIELGYEKDLNW